eukprot:1774082-Rhodomonas_salina.1
MSSLGTRVPGYPGTRVGIPIATQDPLLLAVPGYCEVAYPGTWKGSRVHWYPNPKPPCVVPVTEDAHSYAKSATLRHSKTYGCEYPGTRGTRVPVPGVPGMQHMRRNSYRGVR